MHTVIIGKEVGINIKVVLYLLMGVFGNKPTMSRRVSVLRV